MMSAKINTHNSWPRRVMSDRRAPDLRFRGRFREGVSIGRESRTFGTARPGDLAVTQIPFLCLELLPVDLALGVPSFENLHGRLLPTVHRTPGASL